MSKMRAWRTERGWSLADMAGLTGISAPMLSRVERGEADLAPSTKVHVAHCLGVQVADLFSPPDRDDAKV